MLTVSGKMLRWALFFCFHVICAFEVPDATVEVFSPKGFEVSIPNIEGIKLFAFHGKINEEMNGREAGTFSVDITKPKDGRWRYHEPYTKLKVGDIIYFWTFVIHEDGRGYPRDDQKFEVTELIEIGTSTTKKPVTSMTTTTQRPTTLAGGCEASATTFNGGKVVCKGKIIFNEPFGVNMNRKYWKAEERFSGAPDYEFVMYMNKPETLFIKNNLLRIKPRLIDELYGEEFICKPFDFGENCTGVQGSQDCFLRPDAGFLLPPVASAQITTKNKFSFKYGNIEIRAKLPKGDWLYPELYLNPARNEYGENYNSGQMRVAFSPGNEGDNQILCGGIILGTNTAARTYGMKNTQKQTSWSNEFHKFQLKWKPDRITLSVDGRVYGIIYPPTGGFCTLAQELRLPHADRWKTGTEMSPFDKEMFITLGVGVGGFNFEDRNDGKKPWRNGERLSVKKFYNAREQWGNTWDESSELQVDYVKVSAL